MGSLGRLNQGAQGISAVGRDGATHRSGWKGQARVADTSTQSKTGAGAQEDKGHICSCMGERRRDRACVVCSLFVPIMRPRDVLSPALSPELMV